MKEWLSLGFTCKANKWPFLLENALLDFLANTAIQKTHRPSIRFKLQVFRIPD